MGYTGFQDVRRHVRSLSGGQRRDYCCCTLGLHKWTEIQRVSIQCLIMTATPLISLSVQHRRRANPPMSCAHESTCVV